MIPAPPGWYPDPWQLAPLRWWDSYRWTQWVTQPAWAPRPTAPPNPTLPLRAAVAAVVSLVAVVAGLYALVDVLSAADVPALGAVSLLITLQYSAMAAICLTASYRWATGHPARDLGLRSRVVDLGWGPLGWVALMVSAGAVTAVARGFGVPFETNNPFAGSQRANGFELSHSTALVLLGVVMVICAPVFEEVLFRGVVLRALRSRLPAPAAVTVQGLVFGAFHFDPARGAGNIGLILALSAGGVVLGTLAERTGRLAPGMIAHALQNAMVFSLGLLALHG